MTRTPGPAGSLEPHTAAGTFEKSDILGRPDGVPPAGPRGRRRGTWLPALLPLAVAAAFGLGAYAVTTHMTPWYSTGETLYFPAVGGQGAQGVLSSLGLGASGDSSGNISILNGFYSSPQVGSGPNTAIMALSSGNVQGRVSGKLHLSERWHLPPNKVGDRLGKNVSWGVDRNGLLSIQATDTDPRMAQTLVNAYVQAMQDFSKQLSVAQSHRVLVAVQNKLANKRALLTREQDQLVALQQHTGGRLPLGPGYAVAYADLAGQERAAQADLSETDAKIASLSGQAKRSYTAGLTLSANVPFAQDALQRYHKAEQDFAALRAVYGPDYPAYREAEQRVGAAKAQAQAELMRQYMAVQNGITPDVATLLTQRRGLEARARAIQEASASLKAGLLSLPSAQMQEERLTSDVKRDETLVDQLAVAAQQAELAEQRDVPTFEVVDGAGVPDTPSLPRVGYTTALATVAGFLLALAWLAARAMLRQPATLTELRRWTDRYGLTEDSDGYALDGTGHGGELAGTATASLPSGQADTLARHEALEAPPAVVERTQAGERRP